MMKHSFLSLWGYKWVFLALFAQHSLFPTVSFSSILTFISHMSQEWVGHSHWELSTASLIGNLEDTIGVCQICIHCIMTWWTSLLNNPSDLLYPFLGSTGLVASFLEDTETMGVGGSHSVCIFSFGLLVQSGNTSSQLYWESTITVLLPFFFPLAFADGEKRIQLRVVNS